MSHQPGSTTQALGYGRYLAQGGDWGGFIASRLGFDHPEHVLGVHSTSFMVRHDGAAMGSGQAGADATEAERAWAAAEAAGFGWHGAYSMVMGTRPLTLAYAMADSPVGAAAWVVEKFHAWADLRGRAFGDVFSPDRLITEVMVYLVSESAATASWIYAAAFPEGSATLPAGARVEVPTAFTAYPDPVFPAPPRAFMEHSHRVVRWTEATRGGHFPMLEVPEFFVEDVRAFAREVR